MKLYRLESAALTEDGTAARRRRNEARRDPDAATGCFGGDSSSSSSSSTIDKRQVVDNGGIGVSSDTSQVEVNLSMLDAGAIEKAIDLAKTSTAMSGDSLDKLLGFAGSVLKLTGDSAAIVKESAAQIGDAYKTAADMSSGQRFLIAGGLVLAGIVAVKSFGGK